MPTNTKALQVAEPAAFIAGKNKIINGDFGVWQRGTSATVTSETYYTCDRFRSVYVAGGATVTWSQQSFTPGTAPVTGYEAPYFSRIAATSGSGTTVIGISQRIEDVRTFAGQTVTFSFWAKAEATRTATILINQSFGSGGSTPDVTALNTTQTIGTTWTRYSFTVAMPSVSGKTIGTSSYVVIYVYYNTAQASGSPQFDTWGWQLEAGSVATPFQTATGTIEGEIKACERYYQLIADGSTDGTMFAGYYYSATDVRGVIPFRTTMRTGPTLVMTSGTNNFCFERAGTTDYVNSLTIASAGKYAAYVTNTTDASGTAGDAGYFYNRSAAIFALSAEL